MDTRHEEPHDLAEELDLPEQLDDDQDRGPHHQRPAVRAHDRLVDRRP